MRSIKRKSWGMVTDANAKCVVLARVHRGLRTWACVAVHHIVARLICRVSDREIPIVDVDKCETFVTLIVEDFEDLGGFGGLGDLAGLFHLRLVIGSIVSYR
jgi:hypothetical protein